MDSYWRDDLSQAKRAAILADWCDELEDWPVESIKGALRQHRREFPSKKPNPGHIYQRLAKAWGERNAEAVRAAAAPRYQRVDRGPVERRMAVADELSERFPGLVKRIDQPKERASSQQVERYQRELRANED